MTTHKPTTPALGSAFFAAILAAASLYFVYWGLGYTHYNNIALFLIATFFGIFMAFNIGGNDVANSFGTSVGAGTLTVPQALGIAAIFEVSGAILAGASVTDTIKKGIVDMSQLNITPNQLVYVMLSALIAAALWLLIATKKGLPVSTTHAIIGGILGASVVLGINFGGMQFAFSTVYWGKMGEIAVSWVLSPVLGAIISYILYGQIKKRILQYNDVMEQKVQALKARKKALKKAQKEHAQTLSAIDDLATQTAMLRDQEHYQDDDCTLEDLETEHYRELFVLEREREGLDTLKALQTWVPIIASLGGVVMASLVLFKGLKNANLGLSSLQSALILGMMGAIIWLAAFFYTKSIRGKLKEDLSRATFIIFSWMQVFTASAFAFSHGSNDIANAVGPFVAIIDTIRLGALETKAIVPTPVMVTFGIALISGLWFIGKEVIATVGTKLAEMHPASGFAAELAAAVVVMGASILGLPVSSTHILVGAVLGIGMVNKNTNWAMMRPIGMAWVITLPAAATISALSFVALLAIFG